GLPALVLKLMEKGWDKSVIIGDVQPAVERLHPADQLRGALRRIGIGVEDPAGGLDARPIDLVGRLPLQVAGGLGTQWAGCPGIGPGDLGVVTPSQTAGWNRDELPVHVLNALVVGRAGNDEAILGRSVGRII